jgi:outer membrane protein
MSVAFIRSDFARKLVSVVCLLAFPAAAQQSNASLSMQPEQAQGGQPGAPMANAPQPKSLPQPTHVDYSKPSPLLPNPFARYIPRNVPPPSFTNAPKIEQLIQNGKLLLSLNDAIAIALADNLDIAVARYNLPIADTDILRTKSGASFFGVNTGVVQNTPGGGNAGIGSGVTGAGAGGTSAGAGGAGVGAGGFVGSTSGAGPQPDSFDPAIVGSLTFERSISPQTNAVLSGTSVLNQNTTEGDISYQQGFSPGTALSVGFRNGRFTSNSSRNLTNPSLQSSFRATVRQHLLQGFGVSLNTRLIRQAKNNKKITEEAFRLQVITTVSTIENIYWDLVNAYEDYKVKARSLALAQKTLSDNQKQVDIGTLAPLDVVRAQSSVATAEQDLIISKTNLQLQQLVTKNALTRTLPSNSPVVLAEVIPTDTIQIPDEENLPPVDELVQQALTHSPGYLQQKINLQNNEINIKGTNNGLLPVIDLVGFYGASAIAGLQNPLATCVPPATPANSGCALPGSIAPSGFGDAFGNLFNSSAPDKGIAINIQIPLANRAAQATQVRSRLEYRQSQLALKSLENQIAITVRNDAFTLQQNRARVAAAQKARELSAKTLDAEQKKYNLGASTYLAVLQDERDLAAAESALVAAMTNYAKSKVLLDRDIAQTLERNNIKLDEAVTGNIRTQPNVPGVVPNVNTLKDVTAPAQPPPQ